MLFAYTLSVETAPGTLVALRAAVDELNAALLPIGYGLAPLWDATPTEGLTAGCVRGYEPNAERGHMLALVHVLRQLSRRFPTLNISLSGGCGLPPTQLKDGHFDMFADAYERAVGGRSGWVTPDERVMRIPS